MTPSVSPAPPVDCSVARVLVNSCPKSGTHLLTRCLQLLGFNTDKPHHVSSATADRYVDPRGPRVMVGVGMPVPVSDDAVRRVLGAIPRHEVLSAHVLHTPQFAAIVRDLGFRMLLAVRDPRDVCVSLSHHMLERPRHRLHAKVCDLSADERLMIAIRGLAGEDPARPALENIGERMRSVLPWRNEPEALLVPFEKLVGSRGGGSDAEQAEMIRRIAAHVGVRFSESQLHSACHDLFGAGKTFRKGTIGQWRECFRPEHAAAFDEVAGSLLGDLGYADAAA